MRWFVQSDLILDFCLEWLNCGRMETDPSSASWYGFRSIPCFVVCWCWSRSMVQGVGFNCPPLQHVRPCCYTTGITADYHRVEKRSSWRSEMHLCSNVVEGRRRGLPRRPALWLAGCRARIPVAEVCAALFLVCTRTKLISCKNWDENVDEFQSSDMDEYEQVRIYLDYL